MPTKPTKFPTWATDGTNVVEPPDAKKATGWVPLEEPPSSWFNWWQNNVNAWVEWLDASILAASGATALQMQKIAALNLTVRMAAGGFTGNFYCAAFGVVSGGYRTWVAVGAKGQYSRDDCQTWSAASTDLEIVGIWYGVAFGAGVFVTVGADSAGGGATPLIRSSTDGSGWTARTLGGTPAAGDTLRAVTYGGGLFVAVGDNGHIQTSPDGVTWTKRMAASATDDLAAVAYRSGHFVAVGGVGSTAVAEYSTDGITWSRVTFPASVAWMNAIAASDDAFVAFGNKVAPDNNDAIAYTSTDGATWTLVETFADYTVNGVTCIRGLFVAGTNRPTDAAFGTNLDVLIAGAPGSNWTIAPVPCPNSLYGLASNGDKVLVVGHAAFLADSLRGVT